MNTHVITVKDRSNEQLRTYAYGEYTQKRSCLDYLYLEPGWLLACSKLTTLVLLIRFVDDSHWVRLGCNRGQPNRCCLNAQSRLLLLVASCQMHANKTNKEELVAQHKGV